MLDHISEWFYQNQARNYEPHREKASQRIDLFINSLRFPDIQEVNIDSQVLAECRRNAGTQERKTIVRGDEKFTFHGFGNNVVLLQDYKADGEVRALSYLDFTTGKLMELLSGLSQFRIKVIAREGTYKETGNKEFSYDTFNHQVYVPGERIDPSFFHDGDDLSVVAMMSLAPAHEIGHLLLRLDEKLESSADRFDIARELSQPFGRHRFHSGSSEERIAMSTAVKAVHAAHKQGVQLWRNYRAMDIIRRLSEELHW